MFPLLSGIAPFLLFHLNNNIHFVCCKTKQKPVPKLVKNDFDVSGEVLAAFNRSGSSIGELMTFSPSEYIWVPAHEGQRSTINISIYDQADRPVHFRDTSVSIMLIFRKARA